MPSGPELTLDLIGCRISVTTSLGETLEGIVFTVDQKSSTLVLEQGESSGNSSKATYHAVSTGCVTSVKKLADPPARPAGAATPALPAVDLKMVRDRSLRAVAKAKEEAEHINTGVSTRDQAIFDALRKTMPCTWMQKNGVYWILVMEEVLIQPPFTPDTCHGTPGSASLARLKKVLAGINDKLQL